MIRRPTMLGLIAAAVLLLALAFVACGGGGNTTTRTPATATINLSLSDPAPCSVASSTGGIYKSVFIAVSDVQINASATAGDNDPNWLDLTPSLSASKVPLQVDLLALPNPQCFLASLGSATGIPAGTYQQIRIFLADNNATNVTALGTNNGCSKTLTPSVNCVVLPDSTVEPLQLSSEVKTGIKIPSGQIAGGQFSIAAGETKDLDIDIDSCGSVVVVVSQGNAQFRLKPVLHAGEVSLTPTIQGKLVGSDNLPIAGVKAIVALEQRNGTNPDSLVMQTTTDSNGNFIFCPVPNLPNGGTYDIVAVVVSSTSNTAFAATITTGATPGKNVGNVVMNAATGTNISPATLTGDVTTASASVGGVVADIALSAIQAVTIGSTTTSFIIPAGTQSAVVTVTTAKPASCTSATCPNFSATYSLTVPPVNPTTGAFVVGSTTAYTAGASGTPSYLVKGDAFLPTSGATPTPDCSPATQTTSPMSVTAGTPTTMPTLAFVGCQ